MILPFNRNSHRKRRHTRLRKAVFGTAEKPRLCVYRGDRYLYVQALDDMGSRTLASASSLEKEARTKFKGHANKQAAKWVGETLGRRLGEKGIKLAVFDRGGYPYHGVVKEVADAVRGAGIAF
jgi:large subunit ribosomal protein L18